MWRCVDKVSLVLDSIAILYLKRPTWLEKIKAKTVPKVTSRNQISLIRLRCRGFECNTGSNQTWVNIQSVLFLEISYHPSDTSPGRETPFYWWGQLFLFFEGSRAQIFAQNLHYNDQTTTLGLHCKIFAQNGHYNNETTTLGLHCKRGTQMWEMSFCP